MQIDDYSSRDFRAVDLLPANLISAKSAVVTALYSDRGLIFSDGTFYRAGLMGDVTISQSLIDALGMGGRIGLTGAQLDLWNGDRALDSIASLGLAVGRKAKVRFVAAPSPWASDAGGVLANAQTAFSGIVAALSPSTRRMRLALDDMSWRLVTPLQTNLYGGTGGLDGSPDLTGLPKPLSFGWRFNVTPIYLGLVDLGDGLLQTYQSHWRTIAGHDVVRERGLAMVKTTSAPGIGEWRDWPAFGCFQLGFTPNGTITCDVRGDAVPTYAGTTVQIVQRVLSSLGPLFADTDFDQGSLGLLETQILGEVGWGIDTTAINADAAMDDLVKQCGIWMIGNRAGKLRLALPQPLAGVENLALDDGDIVSLTPTDVPASLQPAPASVQIAVAKNWTQLTDISSGVSAADRSLLAAASKFVRISSDAIGARQAQLKLLSLPGLFRLETDAQRRAQALVTWLEKGLRAFNVTTDKYLGQVEIGHVARVTYPLYGLSQGFTGVVAGWSEQIGKRRLTMTLVG